MKILTQRLLGAVAALFLTTAGVWAQTPTIDSNYRYVRGATMAFVRMTYKANGATVTERGVCVSETTEPTVADIKANQETQLTKKGPIYWLKELKPGTKYYMRGYVITSGGQPVYGDPMKFYTIPKGQIGLDMRTSGDAPSNRIKAAAETALYWWNNLTEIKDFRTSIGYNPGTPTAECSYGGWMSVGQNESYQRCGTIMHELLHGVGVIPWADTEWSRVGRLRSGVNGDGKGTGQWLGDRVTEVLTFLENTETHLSGDYQHMWPYGINGASEDDGSDFLYIGNSLVCQALGEDGLQHTGSCFAEPYYSLRQEDDTKFYIKNEMEGRGRYTSFLTVDDNGSLQLKEMTSEQALADDRAAWTTTFTPSNQFYQIRNVGTGRYITFSGSSFTTVERTKATANENLQLMKGRVDADGQRGYWLIQPASNWEPKCINAYANGNVNAQTFNIANSAESQRWLILNEQQLSEFETSAVNNKKPEVASLLSQISNMLKVGHKEDVEGADSQLTTVISDLTTRANSATGISELISINNEALSAALTFLSQVTVTDAAKPFTLTYLIKNPGVDTDTEGWSRSATVNYSCAEFYQTIFDFNQTLASMPVGTYKLQVQAFQRPGTSADSYTAYAAGTNNVNATVYAGAKSAKIAHIASDARVISIGGGTEAQVSGHYMPNDMEAASLYFKKKLYENEVYCSLSEAGDLKIGLKASEMGTSYWVVLDNFRLSYYGKLSEEQILGIDRPQTDTTPLRIFTLDGRQLSPDTQLRPGLYIINGRKVAVK